MAVDRLALVAFAGDVRRVRLGATDRHLEDGRCRKVCRLIGTVGGRLETLRCVEDDRVREAYVVGWQIAPSVNRRSLTLV